MANWVADFLSRSPDAALPIAKRARHSIHFARPNGEVVAHFVGGPCHWLDTDNLWKPIDTRLVAIGAELGSPFSPVRIGADGAVRLEEKTHSQKSGRIGVLDTINQSFSHIQTLKDGLANGGDKLIRSVGNYEQHLMLTETGLREELIIFALPQGVGSSHDDYLCVETAVSESFPDGWLDEFSADGFHFAKPHVTDASNRLVVNVARRYAQKIGNVQYVYTGVPMSWLVSAVYPVRIDPDFSTDTYDGYTGRAGNDLTQLMLGHIGRSVPSWRQSGNQLASLRPTIAMASAEP